MGDLCDTDGDCKDDGAGGCEGYNCTYNKTDDYATSEYCYVTEGATLCFYHGDEESEENECTQFKCIPGKYMEAANTEETIWYAEVCINRDSPLE